MQLLIYPAVDRITPRPSLKLFERGFLLTASDMEWFNGHTCGPDVERGNPWISPLHCRNLAGLPPALIVTAAFDPLRDEVRHAEALRAAAPGRAVAGAGYGARVLNMVGRPRRAPRPSSSRAVSAALARVQRA